MYRMVFDSLFYAGTMRYRERDWLVTTYCIELISDLTDMLFISDTIQSDVPYRRIEIHCVSASKHISSMSRKNG